MSSSIPDVEIKRGDAGVLTLDLHADLTGYTDARVALGQDGRPPAVSKAGAIAADPSTGIVTFAYTADDTAVAGDYLLEVEMLPGPHTWPSGRPLLVRIVPDLG